MSHNAEIERLKAEERRLQAEGTAEAPTKAADMATVVEQLKAGYVERFKEDPSLPKEIIDKKNEISALFSQMETITQTLSQLDVALQTAAVVHQQRTAETAMAATAAATAATAAAEEAVAKSGTSQAKAPSAVAKATGLRLNRPKPPPPAPGGTLAITMPVDGGERTTGHKAVRDLTNEELLQQQAERNTRRKADAAASGATTANDEA